MSDSDREGDTCANAVVAFLSLLACATFAWVLVNKVVGLDERVKRLEQANPAATGREAP